MEPVSDSPTVTRNGFELTDGDRGQEWGPKIRLPSRPGGGRSRRGPCPWTARRGTPRRSSRSRSLPAPSSPPISLGCASLFGSPQWNGDLRRGLRRHPPWMAGDTLLGGMYDGPFSLMGLNLPRGQPKSDNNLNSVIVPFLR
jgi:hypothetical protein